MPHRAYDVVASQVAPRLVAGVRAQVARGQVGREFGRHLDLVYAAARTGAISLDGQNIFIYRECSDDLLTVDFCVGATASFSAVGTVVPMYTPGGLAAVTTHRGDYAGLGAANAAIAEWCRTHQRVRAGPSWEVYGHWDPDPAKLRTEVYYLLHPADA